MPDILECSALPLPWARTRISADPKHVALVGDEQGYLYAIGLED